MLDWMRAFGLGLVVLCLSHPTVKVRGQYLSTDGSEFSVLPQLSGDQVHPFLHLNGEGGIMVWEDNGIDGTDLGIATVRVDAQLQPVSNIMRVNWHRLGDQTDPRAALLPEGGAVYTFEGNKPGRRRAIGDPESYLRWMLPDDRFKGKDVALTPRLKRLRNSYVVERLSWRKNQRVNRRWRIRERVTIERSQTEDPRPFALHDGTVVVVCSGVQKAVTNTIEIVTVITSRNRRGVVTYSTNDYPRRVTYVGESTREIFIQRYNAGMRLEGPELVANETRANNQRDPEVAPMPDGGWVIVWVSEDALPETPLDPSAINIKARLFGSEGQPRGPDIQVNVAGLVCAQPTVTARQDGGFLVAWSQRDLVRSNSWDVAGRVFDAGGQPRTAVFHINQLRYGDQFAPRAASSDNQHLVCWTSLEQDGSREGVFTRLISLDGPAGPETRVNERWDNQQMHASPTGNSGGRFQVVWTTFAREPGFELVLRRFRAPAVLQPPNPPQVAAIDFQSLEVRWDPVPVVGLVGYDLYLDEDTDPTLTSSASPRVVGGFDPESTHSVRLAYRLNDGRRSLRSAPVEGTTLPLPGTSLALELAGNAGEPIESPSGSGPSDSVTGTGGLVVEAGLVELGVTLTWNARPGARYQIQVSDDLNRWIDYGSVRTAGASQEAVLINPKDPAAFFRVIELP